MPVSLQRDIRAFFGKPSLAYDFAKDALFAVADTDMIATACSNAFTKLGCGHISQDDSYTLPARFIVGLPPLLRIYIGCGLQLYGDLGNADLVKIHSRSAKLSLMKYDDFSKPLPILVDRIKIRLRDQEVDLFNYEARSDVRPLYMKSRYLEVSDPDYIRQCEFDRSISTIPDLDLEGYGPSMSELKEILLAKGITIDGFHIAGLR
jgi:DNA phosphorothioation-associated putative methyltransferase